MKKKIFSLSVVVICLCLAVGSTVAYFNADDTAHNIITTGGVGISIVEKTKGVDGTEIDFPVTGINGVMPGSTISKIVSVSNTGESEAWLRVSVDTGFVAADGTVLPMELELYGGTIPALTYTVEDNWLLGDDGYYYYTQPVPAGESTGVLFREVMFSPQMTNEYQNCTVSINISAQAVQTANNGIPEGGSVLDIVGWPED